MSFAAPIIVTRLAGSNADARAVSLRVMNESTPTPQQLGELSSKFDLHVAEVRNSLAGFLTRDGELSDGSAFRIVSNSGSHTLMLWPAGGAPRTLYRLPHGFAVVTNWRAPFIYKLKVADHAWSVAPDTLPQLVKDATVKGYNLTARLDPDPKKCLVLPGIHVDKPAMTLWDFGPHHAPAFASASYVVPTNLQYPVEGVQHFDPTVTHFLADYALCDASATVLYGLTPPDPVLLEPEPITPLPGCTDATGTTAVLQVVRKALLSEVADLWKYRFCNEVITRTDAKIYAASARYTVDVSLPIAPSDSVADTTTTNNLGLSLSTPMFAVAFYALGQANFPLPPFDSFGNATTSNFALAFYGAARIYTDLSGSAPSDVSYKRAYARTAGAASIIDKAIALPAVDAVEYAKLTANLHYPATMALSGGTVTWVGHYDPAGGERGYSREGVAARRVDATHNVDGAPDVSLDLVWTTARLLEGTTTGRLAGTKHVDTYTDYKRGGDFPDYSYAIAGPHPVTGPGTQKQQYDLWQAQPNLIAPWQAEWVAFPVPSPPRAPGLNSSLVHATTLQDTPITCTGSYLLTSRHIIDYDHRSRFFAAIRCEVQCSGAAWGQNPSGYQGEIFKTADPTYIVKIYFECNWNGVTAQQLLATATATRPAFEFKQWRVRNIYTYPADDTLQPMDYWMPPELGLPKEVMSNLMNLSLHQGVNPHQVARMFYPAPPDAAISPEGIEYTRVVIDQRGNASATMQNRFVDGQLYARTFKLSDNDVKDALWMLHALCVDAPANNHYPTDGSDPGLWFYMPDLGNIVMNTVLHVEVRNGVIEQWSDNVPHDTTADSVPTADQRHISLYEV